MTYETVNIFVRSGESLDVLRKLEELQADGNGIPLLKTPNVSLGDLNGYIFSVPHPSKNTRSDFHLAHDFMTKVKGISVRPLRLNEQDKAQNPKLEQVFDLRMQR